MTLEQIEIRELKKKLATLEECIVKDTTNHSKSNSWLC